MDAKSKERQKEKEQKEKELRMMENGTNKSKEDNNELPFIGNFEWDKSVLKDKGTKRGDSRIKRLRELLEQDLAQEYFGEDDGRGKIPYGLKKRTLKGFNEIKKRWRRKLKDKGYSEEMKEKLEEELNKFQRKNKYTIGSANLFKELLEEKNWIIWKQPAKKEQKKYNKNGFTENPLDALCDWYELKEDIEKLKKPIQFTPADLEHSRRLFRFGDVASGFDSSSGRYGHDKNSLSFRAPIVKMKNNKLNKLDIKIYYSAPRLMRDSLRDISKEEELEKMPWIQPMAKARFEPLKQNFSKSNVQLMPQKLRSGKWSYLLNFSVGINLNDLQEQIKGNTKVNWERNCIAAGNKYLKWPKSLNFLGDEKMKNVDWFDKTNQFSCLGVDLGQRTAAAFALVSVLANNKEKGKRYIGQTKNKNWHAFIKAMGLLRLPGEGIKFYQRGQLKIEPYGVKGRKASKEELKASEDIISSLEDDAKELLGEEESKKQFSFPELNDKLLVAIRRSQGRLSQYYRWVWMLGENNKKDKALKEIKKEDREEWSELSPSDLQKKIKEKIPNLQKKIEGKLLIIVNRVLPLRGRKWEWKPHPQQKDCHLLCQTQWGTDTTNKKLRGQRGLSIKRIEQIEELRCRFQSLNQSQRKIPGKKPPSWSEMRNESIPDPCPDLLKKLEELKKQRVNQTAHLILAEALGVKLKPPSEFLEERRAKDIHGEYEKIEDRKPVNFIVIEDLSRYLTKQDRSRMENSRLMKWSHRAVTNKLRELCEPYGIPILEVPAAYSSKFCSRTGVPGFRAEEVTFKDKNRYPYKNWLTEDVEMDADEKKRQKFLQKTFKSLEKNPKQTALIPKIGGEVFVSIKDYIDRKDKQLKSLVMQADINAAINICLRAVASPVIGEIHHRIRSEIKENQSKKKIIVCKGSIEKRCFKRGEIEIKMQQEEHIENLNKRSNFFIDRSEIADFEIAKIEGVSYASGKAIWTKVKEQKWSRCEELNKKK